MKLLNVKKLTTGLALFGLVLSLNANQASTNVFATVKNISESAAKKAALKDAGVSEKEARFKSVELETDDGKVVYDIDFIVNGVKYSYDIDAKDGSVVSKEVKNKPKTKKKATKKKVNFIGTKKAKDIALKHAKVSLKKATFERVKLDKENGIYIYEIEFSTSEKEYDYDINAKTGKIIKHSAEFLDNDYED